MDYFKDLLRLLKIEKEEDRLSYQRMTETMPVAERRTAGLAWYPIAIRDTELGQGDYLTVEVERTTHQDIIHQLRFGMSAALFSNHNSREDRVEGIVSHISGNRLKITLRTDELPEWARDGKLGIDAVFDEVSYEEMERALKLAPLVAEKKEEGKLVRILTGAQQPSFNASSTLPPTSTLNRQQQEAVNKILRANELAIVHGPPGTGKTTTLVQAIKALAQQERAQVLVVAPSNAAVDLISEKLSDEGLNIVRIGNPVRVSEKLLSLTLDQKMAAHASMKEVKRLKKQASEFRDLAHKYKRNFGRDEREQRRALFAEARSINKQVEQTEQYIIDDVLSRAQVITATLVGANHYTVQQRRYQTAVIDEAGQALEPACWIPILKAQKLVLAGDHCQLPPTIKSTAAAQQGLSKTLMEKCVALYPETVVLLQEQYRMNEQIMGYPSAVFYHNKLQAHASVAHRQLLPDDAPLAFIDTAGCGFEEKWEGVSISNPEEAAFLLKHLAGLTAKLQDAYTTLNFPSIAVISPYKEQVETLKEQFLHSPNLQSFSANISINTIDSFQGQERDVVYISMTRSNTEGIIGFLSDIRRMNVAMTRARKKLVVIGDSATLSQFPFYANFISYAQECNAYASAWEFIDG
jgi:ATP-dependent RNA/DNA helicase IGHMBP2